MHKNILFFSLICFAFSFNAWAMEEDAVVEEAGSQEVYQPQEIVFTSPLKKDPGCLKQLNDSSLLIIKCVVDVVGNCMYQRIWGKLERALNQKND